MNFQEFEDSLRDPRNILSTASRLNESSLNDDPAVARARRLSNPRYVSKLLEFAQVYKKVLNGNGLARFYFVREAMTSSDFPVLMTDISNRSVLTAFAEEPYSWSQWAKKGTISDFRPKKIMRVDGGTAYLNATVDDPTVAPFLQLGGSGPTGIEEFSQTPSRRVTDTLVALAQLYEFTGRAGFSWQTLLNDDLDALKDIPARFGIAARRTQEAYATTLIMNASGLLSTFFNTANKNVLTAAAFPGIVSTDNEHLSIGSLSRAYKALASRVDRDGRPIPMKSAVLMVGPGLIIDAKNILNATQLWVNEQGGVISNPGTSGATSAQRLQTENWAKGMVSLAINYEMPVINTTNGQTAWVLFVDPTNGRPALELEFLSGREEPELFMKTPNSIRIGEGSLGPTMGISGSGAMSNPFDGDFDNGSVNYKVRQVLGGVTVEPLCAMASTGVN